MDTQPVKELERTPKNYGGDTRRFRASTAPQPLRIPPDDDDLEDRIGDKLLYSIKDLAELSDRSPATIFRYLRLGQLQCIQSGGIRRFTRAAVLDFLRNGTRRTEAA